MLSRWISALLGIALLFGTYYFAGVPGLTVLCCLVVFIAAAEYSALFEKTSLWLVAFLAMDALMFSVHFFHPSWTLASLMASFVVLSSLGIVMFRNEEPKIILGKIQWTLWGIIYTGIFPSLAIHLLYEKGLNILLYLLITVFLGDTLAFFSGRFIGGPKIFPNISPKKTVSGAIGGLFGSAIFGSAFLYYVSSSSNHLGSASELAYMILMSAAIGLFAQFGDFFESLIKRVSGKKDSGRLMPGHGGFLDRLDGVYFGSAMLYLFCVLFDFAQYF